MKVGDYMNFDPNMLETNFIEPVTSIKPIKDRKYTLTHSDTTGMLFLDVGIEYNYSAINKDLRDELLGKWKVFDYNSYILIFYAYVGDSDFSSASMKYAAFKYHLNSALQAVFYGDRDLLNEYHHLLNTPIYIKFDSDIPIFNNYEPYGYVKNYIF